VMSDQQHFLPTRFQRRFLQYL